MRIATLLIFTLLFHLVNADPYFIDIVEDRLADNTGNSNVTTTIQNAINDLVNSPGKGGTIYFPAGRYRIDGVLLTNGSGNPGNIRLIGVGISNENQTSIGYEAQSILVKDHYYASNTSDVIIVNARADRSWPDHNNDGKIDNHCGVYIDGLSFLNKNVTTQNTTAIWGYTASHSVIKNCNFTNFKTGINLDGYSDGLLLENLNICSNDMDYGIKVKIGDFSKMSKIQIWNQATTSTGTGLFLKARGCFLDNFILNGNYDKAVHIYYSQSVNITGLHSEIGSAERFFHVQNSNTITIQNTYAYENYDKLYYVENSNNCIFSNHISRNFGTPQPDKIELYITGSLSYAIDAKNIIVAQDNGNGIYNETRGMRSEGWTKEYYKTGYVLITKNGGNWISSDPDIAYPDLHSDPSILQIRGVGQKPKAVIIQRTRYTTKDVRWHSTDPTQLMCFDSITSSSRKSWSTCPDGFSFGILFQY